MAIREAIKIISKESQNLKKKEKKLKFLLSEARFKIVLEILESKDH